MVVVFDVNGAPGVQRSFEDDGGVAGAWGEGPRADIGHRGRNDRLRARTAARVAEQRGLIFAVQHAVLVTLGGVVRGHGEKEQLVAIGKGGLADAFDRRGDLYC